MVVILTQDALNTEQEQAFIDAFNLREDTSNVSIHSRSRKNGACAVTFQTFTGSLSDEQLSVIQDTAIEAIGRELVLGKELKVIKKKTIESGQEKARSL